MNARQFSSWEEAVNWLLEQPDQSALVRDCYLDRPSIAAAQRFWASDEWAAVRSLLPYSGGMALDVGAGTGIASYALAKDGWRTFAIEPDPSGLVGAAAVRKLASESGLQISVTSSWGESLPFQNDMFDVIHARQVLHHAGNLQRLCAELYRVLRPGGRLIATREHVISNHRQLDTFLRKHPLQRLYGGENAFLLSDYESSLRSAGFVIREVMGPWDSIINFAPFTRGRLRELLVSRIGRWSTIPAQLAFSRCGFRVTRPLLSLLDRRPGRLYSFVADKP